MKTAMRMALVFVVAAICAPAARGQATPQEAMQQVLESRYKVTVIGPGMMGFKGDRTSIQRAGEVLVLRRAGLAGSYSRELPASYGIRDGKPELYRGKGEVELPAGEPLYVHSVHVGRDVVTLGLMSTRLAGQGRIWLALSFFFNPADVQQGKVDRIQQVIDQWLLPQAGRPGPAIEPVGVEPPAAPADLKPGMSREDVVRALGTPRREASFGARTWLTYAGMVVVLENGKLAEVDRSGQPPARVSISSEPDAGDIYLEGTFVGSTPTTLELPAGTYKVVVKLPGYQEWQREVRVLAGSEVNLKARLEK
ncbi:MAG TPA: PEGA domain-containing protein [Candidatus Xenobia bacterium]|nr:PEGA domain-containing protein [Candidatus Xenobia bacterium]